MGHNSLLFKPGLGTVLESAVGAGGRARVMLQGRELINMPPAGRPKSTSTAISHIDSMYPRYDVRRMALDFCGFPLPTPFYKLMLKKHHMWVHLGGSAG